MVRTLFTFTLLLLSSFVFANNIQLQKVSLSDTDRVAKTVTVKMNISWENSWRDSINWDAAWIMIKYKEPKDNIWKWKHAQLSKTGNDLGTGLSAMKMVVPNDLLGAFFYRAAIGEGNVLNENVKLLWNYGAAGVSNIDSVEVRVFATEMVYVSEGSYCLGDGDGISRSNNSYQLKNAPNNYAVITDQWSPLINTENSGFSSGGDDAILSTNGVRISGLMGLDVNNDKQADYPNFPTGYRSFYCMKYKVTQGQYADFLNTVCANDTTDAALDEYINYNSSQYNRAYDMPSVPKQLKAVWLQLGDYMTSSPGDLSRHSIFFDMTQLKFTVARPDRAYGLMDMNKALSFSEWLGLRPMSELEYEKACRGPLAPSSDFPDLPETAFGSDIEYPVAKTYWDEVPFSLSGPEVGTESFTNYSIAKRYMDPIGHPAGFMTAAKPGTTGGDGGAGPYRVGIYATDNSSRVLSGASYYGIMDLSKITTEMVISQSGSITRQFNSYRFGGGVLSALGKNYAFSSLSTPYSPIYYTVSQSSYRYGTVSNRIAGQTFNGFRAVRLAPSDN